MSVMMTMGPQVMGEYEKKKIQVRLTSGDVIKGALFTAQQDYLEVDSDEISRRVTIPFSAVLTIQLA
jgi:hypothetical protein